jgi:hypothetical protein
MKKRDRQYSSDAINHTTPCKVDTTMNVCSAARLAADRVGSELFSIVQSPIGRVR